jgi:predicted nucleotidyltransferase
MNKTELTKKERERLITAISGALEAKESVLFAYIFGSFVSGRTFNDIDIAIFIRDTAQEHSLTTELTLEGELEKAFGLPVDVRIINNAPLTFVYNVLRHKIVIVERDRLFRTDYECLIFKKYADFSYLRKEYLREVINAPV